MVLGRGEEVMVIQEGDQGLEDISVRFGEGGLFTTNLYNDE